MEALGLWQSAFDLMLGFSLLGLAWRTLFSPDLFKSIVLFIAFGLLMAIAWVRLEAPDVALAEATIGAGLTGALLMSAFAKLRTLDNSLQSGQPLLPRPRSHVINFWIVLLFTVLLTGGLAYAVLSLPSHSPGLSNAVMSQLDSSGVTHPVTAVLLNFRGYDTLLEMAVLLLSIQSVWSMAGMPDASEVHTSPVLNVLIQLLSPVLILVSAYLLWVGAHAPGGAFQAGAILGAAGVLLVLSGRPLFNLKKSWLIRLMLVTGPAAFIALATLTLVTEGELLKYPSTNTGNYILLLESLATVSIGTTLLALFVGSQAEADQQDQSHQ